MKHAVNALPSDKAANLTQIVYILVAITLRRLGILAVDKVQIAIIRMVIVMMFSSLMHWKMAQ